MTRKSAAPVHADWLGVALVVLSAIAFSAKAIFVKLAYDGVGDSARIDPVTLLAMRMGLALPLFGLIAWWSGRRSQHALGRRDWTVLVVIGLMGYYGASLFDFWGLL